MKLYLNRIPGLKSQVIVDAKLMVLLILIVSCLVAFGPNAVTPKKWNAVRARLAARYMDMLAEFGDRHFHRNKLFTEKIRTSSESRLAEAKLTDGFIPRKIDALEKRSGETPLITLDDLNEENFKKTGVLPAKPLIQMKEKPPRLPERPAVHAARTPDPAPVSAVPVYCGSRTLPFVCLTFDSGQVQGGTYYYQHILDMLVRTNTPATFFLTGSFIEAHSGIARRIAKTRLFELGNHSRTHPDLSLQGDSAIYRELHETQDIMRRVTGKQALLFRAPYGKLDGRVSGTAARLGLRTIQWDVSAEDFSNTAGAPEISRRILSQAKNGSIVLMHINGQSRATLEALTAIINGLNGRRCRFVTVSELIKNSPGGNGTSAR